MGSETRTESGGVYNQPRTFFGDSLQIVKTIERRRNDGFDSKVRSATLMREGKKLMADDKQYVKESPLKWLSLLLVAGGLACVAAAICYAAREYDARSGEQVAAIRAQTEAIKSEPLRRQSYEEKLAAYARLTEAASKIAAMKADGANAAQLQEPVEQFRTLAWGPAAVAQGADVKAAIDLFAGALDSDADAGQLQQLSLDLAHICANGAREGTVTDATADPDYGANSAILAHMREIARGPEALHAATRWLGLLDAGKYGESWQAASGFLQSSVTQEQWERKIGGLRKALGDTGSRKLKGEDYLKPAAGGGDGERMVLQFDTTFAQKNDATEIVTTILDSDGQWKAAAYSVK